jgi:hypothetical protein
MPGLDGTAALGQTVYTISNCRLFSARRLGNSRFVHAIGMAWVEETVKAGNHPPTLQCAGISGIIKETVEKGQKGVPGDACEPVSMFTEESQQFMPPFPQTGQGTIYA